jgi:GLPGLI family protein
LLKKNNMKDKFSLILVLSFFLVQTLFGQESEATLAKVHYKFKHINNTTEKDKYHDEETVLYLGQHSSYYTSYSNRRMQEELNKQIDNPAFDGNLMVKGSGSISSISYYNIPSKQLLQSIQSVAGGDRYVIDEKFSVLDWKIQAESRVIGGYTCQKATVHFKGRDYTAWFTPEIPFQAGPWKLQGLPGLILDASDSKDEVVFQYAGFDKMIEQGHLVGLPKGAIKTNKRTLEKMQEAYKKNPQAYVKALAQGGGVRGSSDSPLSNISSSKIKSINVEKGGGVQKSRITNNPIELDDL